MMDGSAGWITAGGNFWPSRRVPTIVAKRSASRTSTLGRDEGMRIGMRRVTRDLPSPAEEARNEAEWRAMTPWQRVWGMGGAILLISPVLATFALMPIAVFADQLGLEKDRVVRLMAWLFVGGVALLILVTILATLWAKIHPKREPVAPESSR
jgi:hypothetical protein